MSGSADRWITFAAEDLHAAQILFAGGVWNQACFHAQQCVEKTLKGLIVRLGKVAPPRTHSVAELLEALPAGWFGELRTELRDALDDYYIPTRYPDALPGTLPDGLPGCDEAKEAVSLAERALAEARCRITA
jgi:HEPN domain-containing protein